MSPIYYFLFSLIALFFTESNSLGWPFSSATKLSKDQMLQKLQNDLLNKKGYFDGICRDAEADIVEFNAQIDAAGKNAKEELKKKKRAKAENCVSFREKLKNQVENFNFEEKLEMEKIRKMSENFKKFVTPILAKPKEFVPLNTNWTGEFGEMQNYFENILKPLKNLASAWRNVEEAEKEHKKSWEEYHKFKDILKEKKGQFREMKNKEVEISIEFSGAIKCAGELSDLHLSKFKTNFEELEEEMNKKLGKCEDELKMLKENVGKMKNEGFDENEKENEEKMVENANGLQFVGNSLKNLFQKIYSNHKNAHQPVWMGEMAQNALATMEELLALIREQFGGQPKMSEAEMKGMDEAKMHGNSKLRQHVKQIKFP